MRRRVLISVSIIVATLLWLGWIDYVLILRDPRELDALARSMVEAFLPDYNPRFGHIEVELPRRFVVENLVLTEKGGSSRELCRVEQAEATLSLAHLIPQEIVLRGVEATLRRDKDGKLNVELPQSQAPKNVKGAGLEIHSEIRVRLERVQVAFEDDVEGSAALLAIDDLDVTVFPDGHVTGHGDARVGALLKPDSPFVDANAHEGPHGFLYRELIPKIAFEIDRRADGRLTVPLDVEGLELGALLRSLLPAYVRDKIWDELNPEGRADAHATLRLDKDGFRPEALVRPRGVSIKPKGFPYPIRGITGRFEVAPFVISWEDTVAYGSGGSVMSSRGTVYVGGEHEAVTLHILVDAHDVPLDEPLRVAMPKDIRAVYDRFGCEGATSAIVQIFKGPHEKDPNIVARAKLDGRVAATFRDVPVKLSNVTGTFLLRQGANVSVDATGDLETGGTAHVVARVVEGDMIHVVVNGDSVPVGPRVIAALPPEARDRVAPFGPAGGLCDFRVVVEKIEPGARPIPTVDVDLRDGRFKPEKLPYLLRASGRVHVAPRWPDGSREGDGKDPIIDVGLDLTANGPGIVAATAKGAVRLVPGADSFEGSVTADVARLELDRDLIAALPDSVRAVIRRFAPDGALTHVRVRADGSEKIDATADGDLLTAAFHDFPYRVKVDRVELARNGSTIDVRRVSGRATSGGRFRLEGRVDLPPETKRPTNGAADDDAGGPLVDLSVRAEEIPVDAALLAALPSDARESVDKLDPRGGRVGGQLRISRAPPLGVDISGTFALDGLSASIARFDPMLEGFAESRAEELRGIVRVEGDRIAIDGVTGRLLGAALSVSGGVDIGAPRGSQKRRGIEVVGHLEGLRADERMRALARGDVKETLAKFPVEGACDLDVAVAKEGDLPAQVRVRVKLLGARCAPRIFPAPVDGLEGIIDIDRGEPVLVDVTGRIGKARLSVRRDARAESFAPQGTAGVYRLKIVGLERTPDIDRALDEQALKSLVEIDPKGPVDLVAEVWMPSGDRARGRFLGELRMNDFAFTAGLRFDETQGAVRVVGAWGGYQPLEIEGAVELDRIAFKKQAATHVRSSIKLRDRELTLGAPAITGQLWGDDLCACVSFDMKTGRYGGHLWLPHAPLTEVVASLAKMKTKPSSSGGGGPVTGTMTARVDFDGVPEKADGTGGLRGRAQIHADKANLVQSSLVLSTIIAALRQSEKGEGVFNKIDLDLSLHSHDFEVKLARLDSEALTLATSDGRVRYDGEIEGKLTLLPFRSGFSFTDFLVSQVLDVEVSGNVADPDKLTVAAIPLQGFFRGIWDRLAGLVKDPTPPPEPPPEH